MLKNYQVRADFWSPDLPDNREHVHLVVHGQLLDDVAYIAEHSTQGRTVSTESVRKFVCVVSFCYFIEFL